MTYRTGNHQPQNLYRDDQYIGVCFDPADTALVVEALKSAPVYAKTLAKILEKLDEPWGPERLRDAIRAEIELARDAIAEPADEQAEGRA